MIFDSRLGNWKFLVRQEEGGTEEEESGVVCFSSILFLVCFVCEASFRWASVPRQYDEKILLTMMMY